MEQVQKKRKKELIRQGKLRDYSPNMKNYLIKFEFSRDSDLHIELRYYNRKAKHNHIILFVPRILQAIDKPEIEVIDRDMDCFTCITYYPAEKKIYFRIFGNEYAGDGLYRLKHDVFCIDKDDFMNWLIEKKTKVFKVLYQPEYSSAKLVIGEDGHRVIQRILAKPEVKNKFRKAIVDLVSNRGSDTKVTIYDDGGYNIYWIWDRNNKRIMNGGLIFHRDRRHEEDLRKGSYSIHT